MYNKKRANSHSEFLFNKNIVNSKRSQSEIITTVLIILLVLAAIVIVWQVVKTTVSTGAGQVSGGTDCMTVSLDITKVTNVSTDNLILKRNSGAGKLLGVRLYLDGVSINEDIEIPLKELESGTYDITSTLIKDNDTAPGKKLKIAKLVGESGTTLADARLCDFTDNSVGGVTIQSA